MRDRWGEPISGATVEVVGSALRAVAGGDGCATLDSVPAGGAVLYAVGPPGARLLPQHSGNVSWRRDARPVLVRAGERSRTAIYLPPGDPTGWDPEGRSGTVGGCLLEGSRPVPGIEVRIEHAGGTATATTDDQGCFPQLAVRAGPATMRIEGPAGSGLRLVGPPPAQTPTDAGWALEVQLGTRTRLWWQVSRTRRLSGTVTDDTGAPVAGAIVRLSGPGQRAQSVDASGGRWTAFVEPGEHAIDVRPPSGAHLQRAYGGAPYDPLVGGAAPGTPVRVEPGADIDGLDMVLVRKARITGRVIDVTGAAVDHPFVSAWGDGRAGYALPPGPDGRYAIDVVPGTVRVYATGANAVLGWHGGADGVAGAVPVTVGPGETVDGVDVAVRRGGAVSGRVVDVTGRPVAGAWVRLEHETPAQAAAVAQPWSATLTPSGRPSAVESVLTDAKGRWGTGYRVRAGRYVIRVSGPWASDWVETTYGQDVGLAPIPVTVQEPKERSGVTVVLRRPGDPPPVAARKVRLEGNTVTLPIACPAGCTVELRRPVKRGKRRGPLLARGRAAAGATEVRVKLTHAGRQAVAHRRLRVVARVTPKTGRARSVRLRLPRSG